MTQDKHTPREGRMLTGDKIIEPIYERIELHNERVNFCIRIQPEITVDQLPYIGDQIIKAFNNFAVRDVETISYRWPKDWWQAVKDRFAPKWFLKKYPVQYEQKGHKVMVHYPDMDIPNQRQTVVINRNWVDLY